MKTMLISYMHCKNFAVAKGHAMTQNVFQVIQMTHELDIFRFIPLAHNTIRYAAN